MNQTWQTMDTAPKDGTHILGYDGDNMAIVQYVPYKERGWWCLVDGGAYADDSDWFPTHWMPLPPKPRKE